jgi:hypothetical protein
MGKIWEKSEVSLVLKSENPLVHSMCEKNDCENKATRIIKDLNLYSWVCEECYGKYRP